MVVCAVAASAPPHLEHFGQQPVRHALLHFAVCGIFAQNAFLLEDPHDLQSQRGRIKREIPPGGVNQQEADVRQRVAGINGMAYDAIRTSELDAPIGRDDTE